MTNVMATFRKAMSVYVGVNLSKYEANEMYKSLKENCEDFNTIDKIIIDNEDSINTSNSQGEFIQNIFGRVYKLNNSNTLVIKDVKKHLVLKVGQLIESPLHSSKVTILELGDGYGINQKVTIKNKRGAIIRTVKHQLLGL